MNKFTSELVASSILVGTLAFAPTQASAQNFSAPQNTITPQVNFLAQPLMEQSEVIAAINALFQSNGVLAEGVTQETIDAVRQLVEEHISDVYIKQAMQNIIQHAQALLDASQVM